MSAAEYYDNSKQFDSKPQQPQYHQGPPAQQHGYLTPYGSQLPHYPPRPASAQSAAPPYSPPYHSEPGPYERPASAQGYRRDGSRDGYDDGRSRSRGSAHHQHQPQQQRHAGGPGEDGERGLVSTVVGGGAGAFLGNKVGHGSKLKMALGAVAGAVAANVVSNKLKDHRQGQHHHHHHNHHSGGGLMGLIPGLRDHSPSSSHHHHGGHHGHHHGRHDSHHGNHGHRW